MSIERCSGIKRVLNNCYILDRLKWGKYVISQTLTN